MRATILLAVIAALSGCANVFVRPIANEHGSPGKKGSESARGVRFYRPAPYLLLTREVVRVGGDEAVPVDKATIVLLPDYSQEFVIQWWPGFGNVAPKFTLEDGWNLTSFDSRVESEGAAALASLADLLAATPLDRLPTRPARLEGAPGLYPMVFEEGRWRVDWEHPVFRFEG